jgi:serine/threonine protein kinase
MTMTQTTVEVSPSGDPHCPHCQAVLPPRATFCASCGERITKKNAVPLLQNETDIATRYRITSLVRRRPYVSLFFAIDNQQQRPVALREINIRSLVDDARATACEAVQREYDLLRREQIPSIMPVIDLRHFQGHLYVIAGWPTNTGEKTAVTQLQTLQDVLQSGIGLPDTRLALSWIEQLCASLDHLHRHQIILGDLDPQALILGGNSYNSGLALMVSWLPAAIRSLLPPTSVISNTTNFSAPEALLGKLEPCSDIYSLGAVLYLLLTGLPPEGPALRMQHRLRSPSEINSKINSSLDEFVMKALSIEASERYQNAIEMSEALQSLRSVQGIRKWLPSSQTGSPSHGRQKTPGGEKTSMAGISAAGTPSNETNTQERKIAEIANIDTILVTQLPKASPPARQRLKAPEGNQPAPALEETPTIVEGKLQREPERETFLRVDEMQPSPPESAKKEASTRSSFAQDFKKRVTGILPAVRIAASSKGPAKVATKPIPTPTPVTFEPPSTASSDKDSSLLKQLQRLILGEQKHGTAAAAIIETPLRVQPNQSYTIRIQLMGRNEPGLQGDTIQHEAKKGAHGLRSLTEGDLVYIEVRSALYQSYAFIVQQAAVYIPAQGYAAEITIPMQPLSSGPSGRRDRLHIFFMDELRRPLYEKPFVVELFISHLVQPGREGHNVLTIPL